MSFKAAYIERELGQIQKRLAKEGHVRLSDLDRVLENYHKLIERSNSPQKWAQVLPPDFSKEGPWTVIKPFTGPQTIKALRDAYDEKYNERYAITSGSVSYTRDNGITFKYNVPLPMSEVDAKYPRREWLQMLLDKGITIDNFEEYWTYLSKRDELVELEKHPEVWSSELFGIAPTEDWETYKAAYLDQMFEKFDRGWQDPVYFGKLRAEEALKRSRELMERLEHRKPSLRDR